MIEPIENRVERIMEKACDYCHLLFIISDEEEMQKRCNDYTLQGVVKKELEGAATDVVVAFAESISEAMRITMENGETSI